MVPLNVVLVCVWIAAQLAGAAGAAAGSSPELAGGGLVMAPSDAIVVERLDVVISMDSVHARYALRNSEPSDQAVLVAFALPSLDALAIGDQDLPGIDRSNPNFVGAALTADGQPVTARLEQRLVALGLDITEDVFRAGLPLFPLAADMAARIAELTPERRADMIERGILRRDGDAVLPAWTLRSTLYWRQVVRGGGKVTLAASYRPLVGERDFSPDELEQVRKSHCISAATQQGLDRRISAGKGPTSIATLTFLLAGNWVSPNPIGEFQLVVEVPDSKALVSSCRDGLRRVGPSTHEWSAKDFNPDDDLHILILR